MKIMVDHPPSARGPKEPRGYAGAEESEMHALMIRSLAGDTAAYHIFLRRLADVLRVFMRRRLFNSPDMTEDIVQEVLLALHRKRHMYDPRQPVMNWVYTIARYKLIDYLRRERRLGEKAPVEEADLLVAETADEAGVHRMDVERLLARLPAKQQILIRKLKLEMQPLPDVAASENMSESAVKVAVHRGIKRLVKLVYLDEAT